MINLENYRTSQEYREILRILQKSSTQQDNILWQSFAAHKNIVPIHHFEIDFVSRELVIFFDSSKHKVNSLQPIYLKLDYRGTIFKVSHFRQSPNAIHFSFPEEIKTQELRMVPRHVFNPHIEKHVAMRPALNNLKDTANELHFRSIDISPHGLGLMVSEHNRNFLKNNRLLWVTRLQDYVLPAAILAEVVYINNEVELRNNMRRLRELKVGLKLSEDFPDEYYNRFLL